MFDLKNIPPVVKNLLIINGLFFLATVILDGLGISLIEYFGRHYWGSVNFYPHQLITSIFIHGSISHLVFNMLGLWIFGKSLELVWGAKRFLIFYIITGMGAGLIQLITLHFELSYVLSTMSTEAVDYAFSNGYSLIKGGKGPVEFVHSSIFIEAISLINTVSFGASGALFGILLAFGMLFPNREIMLMIPPMPIKAKWMVIGYGAMELWSLMSNDPNDNVGHIAHLGGMIFGFILIKMWQKDRRTFY